MIKASNYVIVFLILFLSESNCQIKFGSNYLKYLYENLPSECKVATIESTYKGFFTIKTNNIIRSHNLTIVFHLDDNTVEDIGLMIIDSTLMNLFQSEIIPRFVERKILELLLISNNNDLLEKMKEDKIDLIINGYSVINFNMLHNAYEIMKARSDVKLRRDSLRYEIIWINSVKDEVTLSFPATNTLIRAKDKKELDDELTLQLKNFHYNWLDNEIVNLNNISANELRLNDDIYYISDRIFYINEINNTRYFSLDQEKVKYIFEPNYFEESFCNFVQNPLLDVGKKINLRHRVYGYNEVNYTIRFSDLVAYFKDDFVFYTGVEQRIENGIKAVVIIQNNFLNVIHLLVFDLKRDDLFNTGKLLSASFHTNIPTDNIKNLFEDYEPQKKHFKVKIK